MEISDHTHKNPNNYAMAKPKTLPEQEQPRPGKEHKMKPEPEIIRKNYKGSDKLKGKVALITGGDSGIGRSVAVHFAIEGADVAIIYDKSTDDAKVTKKMVEEHGRKALLIKGDLKKPDFCKKAVKETADKLGRINVLVNNAGVQFPQDSLGEIDDDQLHLTFETNVYPLFYITKDVIGQMKSGDCIINTTSITAYRGHDALIDYSATKGAVLSFTRALSGNLASKNIRVNAVAPGPIWTPLIPSTFVSVSDFGKDSPLGRVGQPSEVAPAFVFLACDDSSYVTGQVIHVNGGSVLGG